MNHHLCVGIDVRPLRRRERRGVARYTWGLLEALAGMTEHHDVVLFRLRGFRQRVHLPRRPAPGWSLRCGERSAGGMRCEGVDVLHTSCTDVALPVETRLILTVHDCGFAAYPDDFRVGERAALKEAFLESVRRAGTIIADSQTTALELERLLGVPRARIRVVYPGLDPVFRRQEDPVAWRRCRARHRLPERFFLYVGGQEPRKNLSGLLEAYGSLDPATRRHVGLVIAGMLGRREDQLQRQVREHGLSGQVFFSGYLRDRELVSLLDHAEALVAVSFYEGFGLPILEALARGTRVVASDIPVFQELYADSVLFVDPHRPQTIAEGMRRTLDDGAPLKVMAYRGQELSRRFVWEQAARATLDTLTRS